MLSRAVVSCFFLTSTLASTGCFLSPKKWAPLPAQPPTLRYCDMGTPEGKDLTGTTKAAFENYANPAVIQGHDAQIRAVDADSAKKELRNRFVYRAIHDIVDSHNSYMANMYVHSSSIGIVTDLTLLGLTGATSVAGGEATKSALGAASSGIAGTKAAIQKNFFDDVSRVTLIQQMTTAMMNKQTAIMNNLKTLTYDQYSLYTACTDAQDMYNAGIAFTASAAVAKTPQQPELVSGETTGQKIQATQEEIKLHQDKLLLERLPKPKEEGQSQTPQEGQPALESGPPEQTVRPSAQPATTQQQPH